MKKKSLIWRRRKKRFFMTRDGWFKCVPSCVPKHRQHATYAWLSCEAIERVFCISAQRSQCSIKHPATCHPGWKVILISMSHMVSLSVHFLTGATVVSWRVNNQEQLFVRWVRQSFWCSPASCFHLWGPAYRPALIFRTSFILLAFSDFSIFLISAAFVSRFFVYFSRKASTASSGRNVEDFRRQWIDCDRTRLRGRNVFYLLRLCSACKAMR